MEEEHILELVGYVKASKYRPKILYTLSEGMKMPSEIGKELKIPTSQVSNLLLDLKKRKLVCCANPNMKKGRMYKNTEFGFEVLKYLK